MKEEDAAAQGQKEALKILGDRSLVFQQNDEFALQQASNGEDTSLVAIKKVKQNDFNVSGQHTKVSKIDALGQERHSILCFERDQDPSGDIAP